MSTILHTAHAITTAWATATELLPLILIPAAVWGLRTALEVVDHLAAAARFTYRAGRFTGRLWFTYGLPALLAAADLVSAIAAEINWKEVKEIVTSMARILIAAVITAAQHVAANTPSALQQARQAASDAWTVGMASLIAAAAVAAPAALQEA